MFPAGIVQVDLSKKWHAYYRQENMNRRKRSLAYIFQEMEREKFSHRARSYSGNTSGASVLSGENGIGTHRCIRNCGGPGDLRYPAALFTWKNNLGVDSRRPTRSKEELYSTWVSKYFKCKPCWYTKWKNSLLIGIEYLTNHFFFLKKNKEYLTNLMLGVGSYHALCC